MSLAFETPDPDQHAHATRLVHAGLALSISTQLATSLIMQGPTDTAAGDAIFQLHRYSGFAALAFAFLFWMTLVFRRRGTAPSALFPWFSGERRRAFAADLGNHLRTGVQGSLPACEETGPLASAVHGFGLLLMTTMAVSGGVYAAQVWAGLQSLEPDGSLAMTVHFALANLVWVYLIAHAGMATIHHFARSAPLGKMWRFKR
ncbi:cytochrome b/b6 domain-containing protein [Mesobacterium sp. TK19101]|uniref:Cytochrome b/b6 domain-containing protein n=1 Tax=Mesobacterium hydrothermale TaxID=3111907 RepID=A0ABU6HHZ9_9RHOB|nr:cytochrome b/b6 domain-containing protein [Mesobacterium sp. TK19101]MEC3862078.1 cytochrome b/b6 domain-containing protein [Mesobacterium sp. TK19101]